MNDTVKELDYSPAEFSNPVIQGLTASNLGIMELKNSRLNAVSISHKMQMTGHTMVYTLQSCNLQI